MICFLSWSFSLVQDIPCEPRISWNETQWCNILRMTLQIQKASYATDKRSASRQLNSSKWLGFLATNLKMLPDDTHLRWNAVVFCQQDPKSSLKCWYYAEELVQDRNHWLPQYTLNDVHSKTGVDHLATQKVYCLHRRATFADGNASDFLGPMPASRWRAL